MDLSKQNERDTSKRNQLNRYVETILGGAAEKGAHSIKFVPEDKDIAVYFITGDYKAEKRVLSIPVASFAELWRLALAPGFETGQHVMTVGDVTYLFRIKEGRMALGEEVIIAVRELKPYEGFPFGDSDDEHFKEEPWERVGAILDSIINLALDRNSDRIEMHPDPGDSDVEIIYYVLGKERRRLPISKQTFRQMVHYMREYYFALGFSYKKLGDREYIIKPKLIGPGDDPRVLLEIEPVSDETGSDELPEDIFGL